MADDKGNLPACGLQTVDHLGETMDQRTGMSFVVSWPEDNSLDAALAMIRKLLLVCPGGVTKNQAKRFLRRLEQSE